MHPHEVYKALEAKLYQIISKLSILESLQELCFNIDDILYNIFCIRELRSQIVMIQQMMRSLKPV